MPRGSSPYSTYAIAETHTGKQEIDTKGTRAYALQIAQATFKMHDI
jgi:hypothetical protein